MKKMIIRYKMPIFITMNLIMTIGMNLAHPVTPTLFKEMNLGPHVFGISFAAMCTTNFIFALIWSNVAHTMKKSRILMISSIGYAIAQLIFGFANNEITIYAARLLSGVFAGGFQVGFITYIVNEAPLDKQAVYITYSSIVVSVGAALGFFIGGYLGDVSIQMTFVIQAILHIITGLLFYALFAPLEEIEEKVVWSDLVKSNPLKIMMDAKPLMQGYVLLVLVSVFISSIGMTLFDQSFGYYIVDVFGFVPSQSGLVKFATGVLAVILNTVLLKRKPKNQSLVLKFLFGSLALLSIGLCFAVGITPFLIISLIWFGAYTVMLPVIQNLVVSQRRNVHEGNQLAGVYNSLSMLGRIFGALFTSLIYSIDPIATFWVSGVIFFISLIVIMIPNKNQAITN